ncbi:MAG TPA: hypothetical protein VFJ85_04915 [Acidimicrobiales bacterium]|nr:hypothetical protein [Acidimicrobiales bacterium]
MRLSIPGLRREVRAAPGDPSTRRQRRRAATSVLGAAALVGLVVGNSIGAGAVAVSNLPMQLDGNTAVDTGPPASDWETFFRGCTASDTGCLAAGDITAKTLDPVPDGVLATGSNVDYRFPEVTTFATGSKDTLNIGAITSPKKLAAGWQCGNSNNLGAKDDLVNVYTVAYRDPTTKHLFLYFGAEKSSNLGDNNIGIWFLQDSSVGCTIVNGRNTDFSGHHVPGDVLLTAAFTKGGTEAAVESHLWVAGADNGGEGLLGPADSGFLCTGSGATIDKACAITNLADFDPPWNHPVKTPGANGTALAPQEFYEGGVDVTQLLADSGQSTEPCITTFVADTRSSQSPTATLFDFSKGAFPVCKPSTSLSASPATATPATIYSGGSQTFTFSDTNDGDVTLSSPSLATDNAACNTALTAPSGDTNGDGKMNPGETWTWSCTLTGLTSTTTITATGHGTDPLGRDVTFCTSSDATHVCDPQEQASATVVVIHPSTTLTNTTATASPAIVNKNQTVTFTFYEKNDGDVVLTSPSVVTDNTTCNANIAKTAGDTNSNGKLDPGETWTFVCTTSFSSPGSATVTATGHGTDPLGGDVTYPGDAQERTTASTLVINPSTELREEVKADVTFTYLEKNTGDSNITSPSVTSNNCATATPVKGADNVHNVGDTGNDGVFAPGETWKFQCTKTGVNLPFGSATTTVTDNATGQGTDAAGTAVPSTGETDSSSVTLTNSAPNSFS